MKIRVDKIASQEKHLEHKESPQAYDISYHDFRFEHPICVSVDVQIVRGTVIVSGTLTTEIGMTCSRCIKQFSRNWTDPAYAFDCELAGGQDTVDLTDHIRAIILTSLPVKPLCRQDCKGLCPACGTDWNQRTCRCSSGRKETRWSGLDKLSLE